MDVWTVLSGVLVLYLVREVSRRSYWWICAWKSNRRWNRQMAQDLANGNIQPMSIKSVLETGELGVLQGTPLIIVNNYEEEWANKNWYEKIWGTFKSYWLYDLFCSWL